MDPRERDVDDRDVDLEGYEDYDTEVEEDEDDLILQRWEGDDS